MEQHHHALPFFGSLPIISLQLHIVACLEFDDTLCPCALTARCILWICLFWAVDHILLFGHGLLSALLDGLNRKLFGDIWYGLRLAVVFGAFVLGVCVFGAFVFAALVLC